MPQDPFAQFVVGAATSKPGAPAADPFAQFAIPQPSTGPARPYEGKAYSAEEFTDSQDESFLGKVSRFASSFGQGVDPRPLLKVLYHGIDASSDVANPEKRDAFLNDLKGLGNAQLEQFRKARTAYKEGRYSEAAGLTLAGAVPLMGPAAAHTGEQIGSGDIAGGLGGMTALLGVPAATKLLPKSIRVGKVGEVGNPAEAAAVRAGLEAGVPVDVATATGNPVLRGAQHLAEKTSIAGSVVGQRASAAAQEGLTRWGQDLAERSNPGGLAIQPEDAGFSVRQALGDVAFDDSMARGMRGDEIGGQVHPEAVMPEQAGAGSRAALEAKRNEFHSIANANYDTLRQIEADPANIRRVPNPERLVPAKGSIGAKVDTPQGAAAATVDADAPMSKMRFAERGSKVADLFEGVYADAVRNGYSGTKKALREQFTGEVASARELASVTKEGYTEGGPAALLDAIRKAGGISLKEFMVGAGKVRTEEIANLQQAFARNWGHRGASSIFREKGGGMDVVAQDIGQSPVYKHYAEDSGALFKELERIAHEGPDGGVTTDLEHYLEGAGVKPGSKWWEGIKEKAAPGPDGAPPAADDGMVDMPLPVDLRGVKSALSSVRDRMRRQLPLTQQRASPGLKAIDNIVDGPDFAPLSQVDMDLGQIKGLSRESEPMLRDLSGGLAATAVKRLDLVVRRTAEAAGPQAIKALEDGRAATTQKYATQALLDKVSTEPVQAFDRLVYKGDAGIEHLRAVAKSVPDELPKIGRALFDQLAEAPPEQAAKRWAAMGPATKKILYSSEQAKAIDDFLKPAPEGSAASLLKGLQAEPVKVFDALTAAKDSGIARLRAIASLAPEKMPDVGRAYLEGLLKKATAEGGFKREAGLMEDWQRLGPETKKILFPDAGHVRDLDSFFLLAKKMAANPNPSGTGYAVGLLAHIVRFSDPMSATAYELGGGTLAAALRSPAVTRALLKGVKVPLGSPAAKGYFAELNAALSSAGVKPTVMASDDQPATEQASIRR